MKSKYVLKKSLMYSQNDLDSLGYYYNILSGRVNKSGLIFWREMIKTMWLRIKLNVCPVLKYKMLLTDYVLKQVDRILLCCVILHNFLVTNILSTWSLLFRNAV